MPLSKNRELISCTRPAHKHLKAVVAALKKSGIPTNGTMIVSEAILSIPLPEPAKAAGVPSEKKRKAQPSTAAVPAL